MYSRTYVISLIVLVLPCVFIIGPLHAQDRRAELDRLVAFARLVGDIKYFSPTDVADSMALHAGWENIVWNGVRMSRNVRDERDFADSLVRYFRPIEPSLEIFYDQAQLSRAPKAEPKELVVSWQHKGLELYSGQTKSFQSIRTNRRSWMADENLGYFDFVSIRVPEGKQGKSLALKLSYSAKGDVLLKSYTNNKFGRDMHLDAKDSVYIFRDSIPKDVDYLIIKVGIPYESGMLRLAHDGYITIDGTAHEIKKLAVLDPPKPAAVLDFRIIENDQKLFEEVNNIGDSLQLQLTAHIRAKFPLAVYADQTHTYPLAGATTKDYAYNKGLPARVYYNTELQNDLDVRLANIILIWNVFRISFVYNPFDEKSEMEFLRETLAEVWNGKDLNDYDLALRKMLHAYKDAHIFYSNMHCDDQYEYSAPITLIHLKDGFYIKDIHEESLRDKLKIGDKLMTIDGEEMNKKWEKQQYFGTGSEANIINRAGVFGLLYGPLDSEARLVFEDVVTKAPKEVATVRNFKHSQKYMYTSFLTRSDNKMLNDSTYYFNLSQNELTDTLLRFIDDPSKHIVFEVRGYITPDSERKQLLNKLITDTVVQRNLLGYQILSPVNKKFVSSPVTRIPENKKPKAKFYFLASESTQSAPETFLDVIKYWKLGTLIGKHTAGANGNINYQYLPGGIMVTFSGLKVVNSDGSKHHLSGVQPDYEVDYTIQDVIQKRDPFIEKALEIISSK
jgi:hypothetical protein